MIYLVITQESLQGFDWTGRYLVEAVNESAADKKVRYGSCTIMSTRIQNLQDLLSKKNPYILGRLE